MFPVARGCLQGHRIKQNWAYDIQSADYFSIYKGSPSKCRSNFDHKPACWELWLLLSNKCIPPADTLTWIGIIIHALRACQRATAWAREGFAHNGEPPVRPRCNGHPIGSRLTMNTINNRENWRSRYRLGSFRKHLWWQDEAARQTTCSIYLVISEGGALSWCLTSAGQRGFWDCICKSTVRMWFIWELANTAVGPQQPDSAAPSIFWINLTLRGQWMHHTHTDTLLIPLNSEWPRLGSNKRVGFTSGVGG